MPPHCTGNKTTSNLLSLKIVLYSSPMKMPRDYHLCAHFFTPCSWSNSHTKPSLIDPKLLQSFLNIPCQFRSLLFSIFMEVAHHVQCLAPIGFPSFTYIFIPLLCTSLQSILLLHSYQLLLRHSFYFHFYFEHLNFT